MATTPLTEPRSTGLRPPRPAAAAFLAVGAAAVAVYFVLPAHPQSIAYVAIGFASVAAISIGARRNLGGGRLPWLLFAGGLLCQVGGDAIFAVYEVHLGREPPAPSAADAFYLAGYPLLAAGIVILIRQLGAQATRAAVLDTAIVFVAAALVQWVFFIHPYEHVALGGAERLVDMAYPAMDVVLLVAFAQLVVGPSRRTSAYRLLIASVALWLAADELYGLRPSSYHGGAWIDALWLLSYVTWGAAALDPSVADLGTGDRRGTPRLTKPRLVLLAAALLTAPVVLAAERLLERRVHAAPIAAGGALIATLVLMRLAELVGAVERARRDERHARRDAENAQRLLSQQNEQLRELDRLKDEFVSSVTHELRTPLTSISGYVELMLEEAGGDARAHLEIVDRNAQRLLGLVNDLLFAARLQSGRLQLELAPVDVRALVDESVEAARPRAASARVELRVRADEVPTVSGERQRLGQLVDNLVSNAIKFTPPGGSVDITLARRNGAILLEVSDTGIGISDAERAHLFERFFRSQTALERQIQGTGLGLYISKAIVDAHGGRIAVDSEAGRGTTFLVELPVETAS